MVLPLYTIAAIKNNNTTLTHKYDNTRNPPMSHFYAQSYTLALAGVQLAAQSGQTAKFPEVGSDSSS